jgi:hypothetical protein
MKFLIDNIPVIGQAYGFTKTAMKVYNSTSPVGAASAAVKGILLDCSPPAVKYPLKCSILALNIALVVTSGGNPFASSLVLGMMNFILEE